MQCLCCTNLYLIYLDASPAIITMTYYHYDHVLLKAELDNAYSYSRKNINGNDYIVAMVVKQ